ncbi:aspartate aminotransferase, mitochondrial [Galendromus occidentalis]|uniref:Aspartate aminotransferase, mitochondrial n=1 Tax=Galendromus occidentalis TaxID=34638 RepID=A0AAJ7L4J2_9ACAR|nr:aspartate aminotransferase, mitochondrial [Galendromus occidentalis]
MRKFLRGIKALQLCRETRLFDCTNRGQQKLGMAFVFPRTNPPVLPHEALEKYRRDDAKLKANLTVGTYWNEREKLHAFETAREARRIVHSRVHCHNYPHQGGNEDFRRLVTEFVLGKGHPALGRSSSFQSLGAGGALSIVGHLLSKYMACDTIFLSSPHWPTYAKIFPLAGVTNIGHYRYLKNGAFDLDGMLEDLLALDCRSAVLLQVCCHNPTGCDPTIEDWKKIVAIVQEKKHRVILDAAYHGYVSGDPFADLEPVRIFVDAGLDVLLCQSFSKNLTMYSDRIGSLTVVASDTEALQAIEAAVFTIVYHSYVAPPRDPALIIATILGDTQLRDLWFEELRQASDRLQKNRRRLYDALMRELPSERWERILHQKGLYCSVDVDLNDVQKLQERYSVYILANGRINLSGLNEGNISHAARALAGVVSEI